MQDVTRDVLGVLGLAAMAFQHFARPAVSTPASYTIMVLAGLAWWMRVRLPISVEVAWALPFVTLGGWCLLLACFVPRLVRELRGNVHYGEP